MFVRSKLNAGIVRRMPACAVCVSVVVAGLAGSAVAQSQATRRSPTPPPAPSAPGAAAPGDPSPRVARALTLMPHNQGGNDWTYVISENGKQIQVHMRDGKVVQASVDGEEVPADRVTVEGQQVRILNADGSVLVEHDMPATPITVHGLGGAFASSPDAKSFWAGQDAFGVPITDYEPPKVMMGVQMAEPDASLRGHFGLEADEATMISAIYEGLPATSAGLELYDIIIACDGAKPAGQGAVRKALGEKNPGDTVTFKVLHRGAAKDVTIKLEAYEAERFQGAKVRTITAEHSAAWRLAPGAGPSAYSALSGLSDDAVTRYLGALRDGQAFVGRRPGAASGQSGTGSAAGGPQGADVFVQPRDHQRLLDDAQRMADRVQKQTEELTLRLRERALQNEDLNRAMQDRMLKLEEMLQRLMEQQKQEAGEKDPKGGKGKS